MMKQTVIVMVGVILVALLSSCIQQPKEQDMKKIKVKLDDAIHERLSKESAQMGMTNEERVVLILDESLAPIDNFEEGKQTEGIKRIRDVLEAIPAVTWVSTSEEEGAYWWLKLQIDTDSPIAWHVVQELGFILNYISIEEPLPTVFKPVSPPPFMNGGPTEFLSWVIEPTIPNLDPGVIADFLEGRLPDPLDKEESWLESGE